MINNILVMLLILGVVIVLIKTILINGPDEGEHYTEKLGERIINACNC